MDLRFLEYGAENGNFSNIDITDFVEDPEGKEVWMRYLMKQGYKNIIIADIEGIGFSKKTVSKDVYVKVLSPSEDLGGTFEFVEFRQ